MKKLINLLMGATKRFTPFDFAVFKLLMVSVGMLIGIYFVVALVDYIYVIWGVAIVSLLLVCYKLIIYRPKS